MRPSTRASRPGILLVEDNDLDAEKVVRAFSKLGVVRPVKRVYDGFEALDVLGACRVEGSDSPSHVVLLDLNMPRMGGIEFLEALRDESRLAGTPVFVLTTSGRESDIAAAHRHHVAGYFVKPDSMTDMIDMLRVANGFWDLCRLPRHAA